MGRRPFALFKIRFSVEIHIHHRTSYHYAQKVSFGSHHLMMRPREGHGLRLERCSFDISPSFRLRWIRDHYENNIGLVEFSDEAMELVFDCKFIVQILERNPFDFILPPEVTEYPFYYEHELFSEIQPLTSSIYVRDTERMRQWLDRFWSPGKTVGTLELLQELNLSIYRTFKYQRRESKGVQSPAETLKSKSGSCRDFATLFIEACRSLGLAARFVSGYLYSSAIAGKMSMHGWTEVYLPVAGWIGFDPSWGVLADSHYIPVAVSRHSEHAPPISGSYFGSSKSFLKSQVDLYVTRANDLVPVGLPSES
jgi:transglutaminase-like putative cysteine protease